MRPRRKKAATTPDLSDGLPKSKPDSTATGGNVKQNVGDWTEIADGMRMRVRSIEQAKTDCPELNWVWPIDLETELGGTRLSAGQLAVVRGRFGENVTLLDVAAYCETNGLRFERLNWPLFVKIIQQARVTAKSKPVQAETPALGGEAGRSLPLMMKKWAYIFGVSPNTMRKLRDNGTYHFRKIDSRHWTLPIQELPAEYLEKYRQHASQGQPKL